MSLQPRRGRLLISVLTTLILIFGLQFHSFSQQPFYDVTSGNGNGVRFWNSDTYKIHMGNASEYKYGPVTDFSIKMNMSGTAGRGWTWGLSGSTPVAALSNTGIFQVKSSITSDSYETAKTSSTKFQLERTDHSGSHAILFNAYKNITVTGSLGTAGNTAYANNAGAYSGGAGSIIYYGNGGSMGFYISPTSTGQDQAINWGNPVLWLQRDGKVGIGQSAPTEKLTVRGNIKATEVKVEAQWWDAVFEEDYMLTPLSEVEDYVKENHHLPEIPSEAEITENGVSLGSTVSLLLKKIEELTLYTIEQQKQLDKQALKLEQLEGMVETKD